MEKEFTLPLPDDFAEMDPKEIEAIKQTAHDTAEEVRDILHRNWAGARVPQRTHDDKGPDQPIIVAGRK